jgi:hypothetical protein
MMDATFSTMSAIDICSQMENHSALLQFASSDSGSPVAGTPPLMHTLQPLLSEAPDTLAEYVDQLPKEDLGLISSVVAHFPEMSEQKVVSGNLHSLAPSSYVEQFAVCNTLDAKPAFELLTSSSETLSGLSSNTAVPYRISVPAAHNMDNQTQYYFQSLNGKLQSPGIDQSTTVTATVSSVPPKSTVASPLITHADSSASLGQMDVSMFNSSRPTKPDLPTPPKKPLTPYMRFSKGVCYIFTF